MVTREELLSKKKAYRNANKEKIKEAGKIYREKNKENLRIKRMLNKEKIKEAGKIYREKNKDKIKEKREKNKNQVNEKKKNYDKEYYIKNKEKIKKYYSKHKKRTNENLKRRKLIDPLYKLKCNTRTLIQGTFKNKGYKKKILSEKILGCSIEEFKRYLESKFEPWMSWENKGLYNGQFNYGWDTDHIIPICSAQSEEDIIKLNHYTNFQPLDSHINRDIKKGRI